MPWKKWFRWAAIAALLGTGLPFASPVAAKTYRNEEYRFQIDVPAGHRACFARAGEHIHGFTYHIDRMPPCRESESSSPPSISIWADYNAAFYASLKSLGPCKRPSYDRLLQGDFHNKAREAASCIVRDGDDISITLYVMTGSLAKSWGEEAGKPAFIYSLSMDSRPDRIARDLPEFRKFISKIKIYPGQPGN